MFRKRPSSIAPSTPLRSSDRRKMLHAVVAQYSEPSTSSSSSSAPTKTSSTPAQAADDERKKPLETWKEVVPEGLRSGKVTTSGEVRCQVYTAPDTEDPLWITIMGEASKREEKAVEYIPTLYAIIHPSSPLPTHLPLLPIQCAPPPAPLPSFLTSGAALFIPAIAHLGQPWRLPDVEEGEVVGLFGYVPVPGGAKGEGDGGEGRSGKVFAVARCVAPGGLRGAWERWCASRRVSVGPGGKKRVSLEEVGRVCEIINVVGDSLWKSGKEVELPVIDIPAPRRRLVALESHEKGVEERPAQREDAASSGALAEGVADLQLDATPSPSQDTSRHQETPGLKPATSSEGPPAPKLTTPEIDEYLLSALLQSLPLIPSSALPLASSTLMSAYVLPNRPAAIPRSRRDDVVLARSSWKKAGKWLKGLEKEGVLRVKEDKSGGCQVLSINQGHDMIERHKPHRTIAEEAAREAKMSAQESGVADGAATNGSTPAGGGKEIVVEEFWKPSGHAVAFWEALGVVKSDLLTQQEIARGLTDYVAKNSLIPGGGKDQRNIQLDSVLGRACGIFKSKTGDLTDTVLMPRTEVLDGLKASMQTVVRIGGKGGAVKKGKLEPIKVAVKSRQGRKMVTLITGVESFGISPDEAAEDLKKICAGSASVNPVIGATQQSGLMEIMVQGSQFNAVQQYMMDKGVPRRWIVLEGDGKGKKK